MANDDSMISAVGIGLKSQHFDAAIQASKQEVDFRVGRRKAKHRVTVS